MSRILWTRGTDSTGGNFGRVNTELKTSPVGPVEHFRMSRVASSVGYSVRAGAIAADPDLTYFDDVLDVPGVKVDPPIGAAGGAGRRIISSPRWTYITHMQIWLFVSQYWYSSGGLPANSGYNTVAGLHTGIYDIDEWNSDFVNNDRNGTTPQYSAAVPYAEPLYCHALYLDILQNADPQRTLFAGDRYPRFLPYGFGSYSDGAAALTDVFIQQDALYDKNNAIMQLYSDGGGAANIGFVGQIFELERPVLVPPKQAVCFRYDAAVLIKTGGTGDITVNRNNQAPFFVFANGYSSWQLQDLLPFMGAL